jgi:hypothetical protein
VPSTRARWSTIFGCEDAEDLETIDVGQTNVEHEEIVGFTPEQRVGVSAIPRMIDGVSRARQDTDEPFGEKPVVFHHKHAHIGRRCSRLRPHAMDRWSAELRRR